jgi:hypothetical protein
MSIWKTKNKYLMENKIYANQKVRVRIVLKSKILLIFLLLQGLIFRLLNFENTVEGIPVLL